MPKPKPVPKPKQTADNTPVFKYIKNHVRNLFHFPMAALIKGAAILSEELFIEAIPAAWELLLETDQETAANSAALFIIASVRAPTFASDIMQRALKHKDPDVRIGAILRSEFFLMAFFGKLQRILCFTCSVIACIDTKCFGSVVSKYGLEWKRVLTCHSRYHHLELNLLCHHQKLGSKVYRSLIHHGVHEPKPKTWKLH